MNDTPFRFLFIPFIYIYIFILYPGRRFSYISVCGMWYSTRDTQGHSSIFLLIAVRLGSRVFIILIGPIRPARTITSSLSFPYGGIRWKVSHVACSPVKELGTSAASFETRGREFCHRIDAIYHDVSARGVLSVCLSSLTRFKLG